LSGNKGGKGCASEVNLFKVEVNVFKVDVNLFKVEANLFKFEVSLFTGEVAQNIFLPVSHLKLERLMEPKASGLGNWILCRSYRITFDPCASFHPVLFSPCDWSRM
jgi:hypothetical protein